MNKKIKFAKQLRKKSTDAELALWYQLRDRRFFGHIFRRQVSMGKYIVDFVCLEKKLIVEADGGQHAEQIQNDLFRTQQLNIAGYTLLRFWNNDILTNLDGVLVKLKQALEERDGC